MISPEHRKELFSISYLSAIASQAGANLQVGSGSFDYGIDVEFKEVITRTKPDGTIRKFQSGMEFHAQVKCSEVLRSLETDDNVLSYELKAENYNDLVLDHSGAVKRLLIVVHVPTDENQRLAIGSSDMVLKNLAYWYNLAGKPETTNATNKTIRIPKTNFLTPQKVVEFFDCVKRLERLNA